MKYAVCNECGHRLDIGDNAVEYLSEIYCDNDCLYDHVHWETSDIEVTDGYCTEEDEGDNDD